MAGQESPASVQQMATRIRMAVDQMTRVVENMLDMSRAGRLSQGTASMAKVAEEVLQELRPQLLDAEVTSALPDELVACAPSVLAQLLRNLITNSVKFQSKQRRLKLALRSVPYMMDVDLILEDNGIGMSDEDLAHALEPYYRGSERLEVPGHGLGLAIVQKTMNALGGSCRLARSALGGTCVALRLPRAPSAGRNSPSSSTRNEANG
jgi:two-component system osmolarity sensor histidine kinase EnvZ